MASTLRTILLFLAATTVQAGVSKRSVTPPSRVKILAEPYGEDTIALQFALRFSSTAEIASELERISSPDSASYGSWYSAAEITELFAPPTEAGPAVLDWLERNGVVDVSSHGGYINIATTVDKANELLDAQFLYYEVDGAKKLRTTRYSVPDEIDDWVELVSPTTYFGSTKAMKPISVRSSSPDSTPKTGKRAEMAENCLVLVTPYCLELMYGYGNYSADADSGSRVGFASFLNQSARAEDLGLYQEHFELPDNPFTTEIINGGLDHQDPRGGVEEANLDVEFLDAVVKTLPLTQFITGGSPPFVPNIEVPDDEHNTNEPYLEFYNYLMEKSNEDIPQVISISYDDDEASVPEEYATRVCNMMGMMGLRGVTLLHASGDLGIGASCQSNDGEERPVFMPQFPGTCPWVTSVGGTQFSEPEIAWVAAGGGFSNYFPQPWYQQSDIDIYLSEHMEAETKDYYSTFTNFSGRGFPDIAAHSASPAYYYFSSGSVGYAGGTSAATPVVAGLVGLLNDARLKEGRPVMGFINPWLYAHAGSAVKDVTEGSVDGCDGRDYQSGLPVNGSIIPYTSWNSTEGWDPASGLGIPSFVDMLEAAIMQL